MYLTTITPTTYPLSVRQGVNPFSADYEQLIEGLVSAWQNAKRGDWHKKTGDTDEEEERSGSLFSDIGRDTKDIRLAYWHGQLKSGQWVTAHFFNNQSVVFEIDLDPASKEPDTNLVTWAEETTRRYIQEFNDEIFDDDFYQALKAARIPHLDILDDHAVDTESLWVGRILRFNRPELAQPDKQTLLKEWLQETIRPQDANDIINGESTHSLKWLNYAMVEENQAQHHYKVEAMILAQYFYSVQHRYNEKLLQEMSDVFTKTNTKAIESSLTKLRLRSKLHTSIYNITCNYLSRKKKALMVDILNQWDYQAVVDNTERLVEACTDKINETEATQRERSSFMTDSLLALIGALAIFDLSLQFVGYSREVVTNPTLGYYDSDISRVFDAIAKADIDQVMFWCTLFFIVFIVVYFYVKRRSELHKQVWRTLVDRWSAVKRYFRGSNSDRSNL